MVGCQGEPYEKILEKRVTPADGSRPSAVAHTHLHRQRLTIGNEPFESKGLFSNNQLMMLIIVASQCELSDRPVQKGQAGLVRRKPVIFKNTCRGAFHLDQTNPF